MSRSIFVDAERCIGCHSCQTACVTVHRSRGRNAMVDSTTPRLSMTKKDAGMEFAHCHHCINAPCMQACPIDAIEHTDGIILLHSEKCDGCGKCVPACPFGAMAMVAALPALPTVAPLDLNAMADSNQPVAAPAIVAAEPKNAMVAQKCDLCHTRAEGPACAQACPLQVIYTVNFPDFVGFSDVQNSVYNKPVN